jgi:hypothetical protein
MSVRLKGCVRCGGDLFPDRSDREGKTLICLQCGVEVPVAASVLERLVAEAANRAAFAGARARRRQAA